MVENACASILSLNGVTSPHRLLICDLTWVAFTAFIVSVKNSEAFQSIKKMENPLIALWLQDKPTPALP